MGKMNVRYCLEQWDQLERTDAHKMYDNLVIKKKK